MPLETELWRRFPIRGAGRLLIPRVQRQAARGPVVASGPFGTRIAVDPADATELSIYLWGTCAPEVEAALERLIVPGEACLAVGAGTGVLSVMIAALNRPGRVVAIEPEADAAARIARQAALNGVAIEAERCELTRLDEALPQLREDRFQLVTIMAAGAEPAVLRGARSLLESSRPAIIFDWCPATWSAAGETPAATGELLEGLGYHVFVPVMATQPAWSVRPRAFARFERSAFSALPAGAQPGSYVVALPATADRAASQLIRPR